MISVDEPLSALPTEEQVRRQVRGIMKYFCVMVGVLAVLSLASVTASSPYDDEGSKIDCCIRGCT
ncbi:MAG: hypothetical protein HY914_21625 [Desulfomonile tiedjei]|nr:hypothetical protein [Desulfomonile tiedjei]